MTNLQEISSQVEQALALLLKKAKKPGGSASGGISHGHDAAVAGRISRNRP
jgi:hypothetical protein